MYHCVILYRLKPGIPLDRVREARHGLQALVETLPGVDQFTVTHNVAEGSEGYNLALFALFENQQACDIFLRHDAFRRVWQEELEPLVEARIDAQGAAETG
jgi:heme-degrading monooxygenase HmoA